MTTRETAGDNVIAFPRAHEPVPPQLAALAERAEATRSKVAPRELSDATATRVVATGIALCTIASMAAPSIADEGPAITLTAELFSAAFWASAFVAAFGLWLRQRRGLIAAAIAATAVVGAALVAAMFDPAVVGGPWLIEFGAGLAWLVVCGVELRRFDGSRVTRSDDSHHE